jgi:hypothetical protein
MNELTLNDKKHLLTLIIKHKGDCENAMKELNITTNKCVYSCQYACLINDSCNSALDHHDILDIVNKYILNDKLNML